MTKKEFLEMNNIKVRTVTIEDQSKAETDYQRNSNYIIAMPSGNEYYNKNNPTYKELEQLYKKDRERESIKHRNICYSLQSKYNISIEDLRTLTESSFIGWYY